MGVSGIQGIIIGGVRATLLPALFLCLASAPAAGEEVSTGLPLRVDVDVEYYLPIGEDRQIHSVFVNGLFGVEVIPGILILAGGVTVTGAWGSIVQWNDDFEDVRSDTLVGGVGPLFLIRCEPFHVGRFGLALDVAGAIVLYTRRFPPGGDIYNFTWRLGGALEVRATESLTVTAGVRWMHVSNGQGLGPQNPSYEGVGFPVGFIWRL